MTRRLQRSRSRSARGDVVDRNIAALKPILESLGYRDDLRYLDGFTTRFEEYKRLDDEILNLAVEDTNVKAQRLSFGPAQQAADAFRTALEAAVSHATSDKDRVEALAGKARAAVLEIQVLQAPHIAEADDAVMTRMEEHMAASATAARNALEELQAALPPDAGSQLVAAPRCARPLSARSIREIVSLSRRNSNVRSLALSFGRKRVVTAECADQLRALEQALAKHEFSATR